MEKIEHPLKWSTFLVILFGIIGFFGSYAATFIWKLLEGNNWQNYLGWVSIFVLFILVFLIWGATGLFFLILGQYKFKK